MGVKRFIAITQSGKHYLVEDHTHLIRAPSWFVWKDGKLRFFNCIISKGWLKDEEINRFVSWARGESEIPDGWQDVPQVKIIPGRFEGSSMVLSDNIRMTKAKYRYLTSKINEFFPIA